MRPWKEIAMIIATIIVSAGLGFLIVATLETNARIKQDLNETLNHNNQLQQQLDLYIDATIELGAEKAQLYDIIEQLQQQNITHMIHEIDDLEAVFMVVITTKTLAEGGFYYTIVDAFDTSDSEYMFSELDLDVGTIMIAVKVNSKYSIT